MLNSKSIGNKIADARKKIHLSQAELAQRVSISPQAVGKWERGESMPDITTLSKLAEIFGVDLNYFTGTTISETESPVTQSLSRQTSETVPPKSRSNPEWNWDMSRGNWADADFSGLKNLKEKFISSNLKNCQFRNADLSELILSGNNVELCDFSSSDLRGSKIQSSNLLNNQFNSCSFVDAYLQKNNIEKCDFTGADFSGAELLEVNFEKNVIAGITWNFTLFKNTNLSNIVFEGTLDNCRFEQCSFYNVKFQNATILNSFFKNNDRFKKVEFIDCKTDKITFAFLKNNGANVAGITFID